MGATSVRRNLFHHRLSKRSVSAAPPNSSIQGSTNGGMSNLSSHVMSSASSESIQPLTSGMTESGDIVVKDKNGGYKIDIPVLPSVVRGEDGDEMEDIEQNGVTRGSGATGADSTAQTEISGREKEKLEASLVEIMYRNRNRQMSSEPTGETYSYFRYEILNLIHQSLRNKVASLDEDKWMFEPEPDSRF
ncbi:hypothetical protein BBP40_000825 [Aspergillus hancockii]|nr:hypothetical protein BBP40_000825 [Aspergillus hancockii]